MTVLMVLWLCTEAGCVVEHHDVSLRACTMDRAAIAAELAHGREVRAVWCRMPGNRGVGNVG